jgi:cytochrome c-type biogenesis protein CcmF
VSYLVRKLGAVFVASVLIGVALPLLISGAFKWQIALGSALALWIVGTHAQDVWHQTGGSVAGLRRLTAGYLGMTIAHLGFAVTLIGIVITSHQSIERDVRLTNGASTQLGALTFTLEGVERVRGPNYIADRGSVRVDGDGAPHVMFPEKRRYLSGGNVMTEAAIEPGVTRDVYVAMGEPLPEGGWTLRLHYKPLVRWVWVGALLMALGGVTAVTDARYRRLRVRRGAAIAAVETSV